ncbi:sugar transferase [Leifsonia poae]|uniref:sugar transferase n=1 Tax=Leifsonia poae TaxID=110933 RepID=UPI003D694E17
MRARPAPASWQKSYAARLFVTDALITLFAVTVAAIIWSQPGVDADDLLPSEWFTRDGLFLLLSLGIWVGWMIVLDVFATRDHRNLGSGTLEYKRLADATLLYFGALAIIAFLFRLDLGRGYFLTALPLGLLLLLAGRWAWRQWLRRQQKQGRYVSRALLLGERRRAAMIAAAIQRDSASGMYVVGAVTRGGDPDRPLIEGVPVLGTFGEVKRILTEVQGEILVVTGADDLDPRDMQRLGWELEGMGVELVVAPALTDIAGPRIHSRPVAGLPLVHIDFPVFEGSRQVAKRAFDIVGSALLILLFSPVMIGVAIAVKATSPGPVFYTQERIGLRGKTFRMIKFRSMTQGADDQLASLLDAQGTSDTPLFKVLNDPRITPVGRFIRKYSLDEFPQLFNVLFGSMSLVGPRPQRAAEVALYDDAAHRRLFMKPGMSGLWQVSGRSRLSWEDAIRLDLYYVENWSITGDFIILWRTVRAVTQADGAH